MKKIFFLIFLFVFPCFAFAQNETLAELWLAKADQLQAAYEAAIAQAEADLIAEKPLDTFGVTGKLGGSGCKLEAVKLEDGTVGISISGLCQISVASWPVLVDFVKVHFIDPAPK